MALGNDYDRQDCSLARTLELVGERWTLLIVRDAFYGVRRYNEFLAHLDVPRGVLANRLRVLVDAGVLDRRRYSSSPPRHEYTLTPMGEALWPALYALAQWGETYLAPAGARRLFRHVTCGGQVGRAGVCTTCGQPVPPGDLEVWPGPGADATLRDDAVTKALRHPHRLLVPLLSGLDRSDR